MTANGVNGKLVASALGPVEEDLNISPGAVILLLLLTEENIARGNILRPNPATATDVS